MVLGVSTYRAKSVILEILRRDNRESNTGWDLNGVQMPKVDKTMHVGIFRSSEIQMTVLFWRNIKKASTSSLQLCFTHCPSLLTVIARGLRLKKRKEKNR